MTEEIRDDLVGHAEEVLGGEVEEQWDDITGSMFTWDKRPLGTMLVGELISVDQRPSRYAKKPGETKTLYTLQTPAGVSSFFAPTVLDTMMQRVDIGDHIRITLVGEKEHGQPGMNPIKQFTLKRRRDQQAQTGG